ncbi:MAG TPA: hypothetical protein VH371_11635 [Candidatus Limnocylindrales bacterium]|jgi:hypothetical protein
MTKRKRYSPFEQTNRRRGQPPAAEAPIERPNLATINLDAAAGKKGFGLGDVVRIQGTGMYAGETATIERLTSGAIPSAVVRTESGNTRHVRTIDMVPVPKS